MPENPGVKQYEREVTPVERFFWCSPFSIITVVARIKGNVAEEMLRTAVAQVQRRHALLRVRVKQDEDHALWFTSEGVQEIPIEIVPRASENDWIRIHVEALKTPYEFETQPAIRFVLVRSPDLSEVIILGHHMICDGMSLAYLARDLVGHLGDPAREVDVLPAPPPIALDNLPADVSQSGLAKFLINRMNRRWAKDPVFFDQEDYRILAKAYWDHYNYRLLAVELSEAETSALVAQCREEGVTVNSALATAFGGAQSTVEGEKAYHRDFVVAGNLRDRLPKSPGEGMGMYAGGVEPKFEYDTGRSFWENARRFHRRVGPTFTNKNLFAEIMNWLYLEPTIFEAIHFKKLGGLVPPDTARQERISAFSEREDVVLRILQRDHLESLEMKHWGAAVTNLGRMDFPSTYGTLELDRLIMQPGGGIPLANVNLVLGAVTCSGKLSLVVEYAEEAVEPGTMEKIKDQAMEFLLKGH